MRAIRFVLVLSLALVAVTAAACSSAGPEATWDAFVSAVDEGRADDALSHLDLVRMSERMLDQDEQMAAASEMFGGAEGIAAMLETQLRDAFASGDFGLSADEAPILDASVTNVETQGSSATLTIDAEGEAGTVYMERIDGAWKIVLFE